MKPNHTHISYSVHFWPSCKRASRIVVQGPKYGPDDHGFESERLTLQSNFGLTFVWPKKKKMLSTWGRLLSEFKLPQNAQPFKVQWSIYTTKFNIQKYYVPPHCGYVSFVGISEQITIISIHVVDSAVFTTKAECLLHAQTHFKFIFVRKVFKSVDPQRDPTRSHEIAEKRGVSKWQWMALYRQRKGQHCIYTKTWDSWRLVIYTSKTWSIWFCSQDLICCRESHSINKNFQLFQKLLCCLQQFITQPRPRVSLSTRFNL